MARDDDKVPHRREAFEDICTGWGNDGLDDLLARVQLLTEWWTANFPLRPAELRIARAMAKRLSELGGLPPTMPVQ